VIRLTVLGARLRSSVRHKLLLMVLLPLLVVLPLLIALVVYWGNTSYDRLLTFKVNSDLAVAHQYFSRVRGDVGDGVQALAGSLRLANELQRNDPEALARLLAAEATKYGLSFINLLDAGGALVTSSSLQASPKARYAGWPVVQRALGGEAFSAVDVFSPDQLAEIDFTLRDEADIAILPTVNAAPSAKKSEGRGIVLHAAAPVHDAGGRLVGVLEGGLLLNRNLDFVDNINNVVYRGGSLPLGSHGTATLFLDDVRIATNVRLFEGARALGTRVSREVQQRVLGRGEVWLDRAFVVNDWYVSAYEPIADSFGRRVGMLYVGYLEAPFQHAKRVALAAIVVLFVVISIGGAVLSLRWARNIFEPLERMNSAIGAIERGDTGARVGEVSSSDEIGRLARQFDRLLDTLHARNLELRRWGDELDRMVAQRTQALAQANAELIDTQRQLVMSEKLAAIGQLTAGVAHEINNPVAVMQGNLDLARELLGDAVEPVRNEIKLIDQQIDRIRLIVAKLLQFARPSEFAGYVEAVDVNALIGDCLLLVRHLLQKGNIAIVQQRTATRTIAINRNELQQVLINLLVNAIHAMADGGTLSLATRDWDDRGVTVSVKDTGQGIRAEDLSRIFDPFFTTKKTQGTGLGLSISYALVERYGGRIGVDSTYGAGAEFTVWLLAEPRYLEEAGGDERRSADLARTG